MSGNVFEWCQDTWYRYSSKSQTNPIGYTKGKQKYRICRGGGYSMYEAKFCRVSTRYGYEDSTTYMNGLRLAM